MDRKVKEFSVVSFLDHNIKSVRALYQNRKNNLPLLIIKLFTYEKNLHFNF